MRSTTYRDGYGVAVELHHAEPHLCPDGVTRTWIGVTVTDDEHQADPTIVYLELQASDLVDLAAVLTAVAEAHGGGR